MIIDFQRSYVPSFGIAEDQKPLSIITVLCVGRSGRDCAAYRGASPDTSAIDDPNESETFAKIRSLGDKIREDEARRLFGKFEHGGIELKYRR